MILHPRILADPGPVSPNCIILVPIRYWGSKKFVSRALAETVSFAQSAFAPVRLGVIERVAREIYKQVVRNILGFTLVDFGNVYAMSATIQPTNYNQRSLSGGRSTL